MSVRELRFTTETRRHGEKEPLNLLYVLSLCLCDSVVNKFRYGREH